MGTRSITHIYESQFDTGEIVCSFYRHWDGYPEQHGKDLTEWLEDKTHGNGITSRKNHLKTYFNGSGEMAVQLMMHIQQISGCSVIPTGDSEWGEEYTYHIKFKVEIE